MGRYPAFAKASYRVKIAIIKEIRMKNNAG